VCERGASDGVNFLPSLQRLVGVAPSCFVVGLIEQLFAPLLVTVCRHATEWSAGLRPHVDRA